MVEPLAAAAAGFASVDECRLVALRTVDDPRGSLTIVEAERDIPFPIERVYHLHGARPAAAAAVTPTDAWSRS
jgi:hypothetical protein